MVITDLLVALSYDFSSAGAFEETQYRFILATRNIGPHAAEVIGYFDPRTEEVVRVILNSEKYGNYIWVRTPFVMGFPAQEGAACTDSEEDILEKIVAVWNNRTFDSNVVMDIDVTDEHRAQIAQMAAARGITIDALITETLEQFIAGSKPAEWPDGRNPNPKRKTRRAKKKTR